MIWNKTWQTMMQGLETDLLPVFVNRVFPAPHFRVVRGSFQAGVAALGS